MTKVIIVDLKGIIFSSGEDVINRHLEYGIALSRLESNAKLYILDRQGANKVSNKVNLEIISGRSIVSFFKQGIKLIQSGEDPVVLVSGDPWESFLASLILRKLSRAKCPIQVQLHADVGSQAWRRLNWRNRVRSPFLPIALKNAEQVRCVSRTQLENLQQLVPNIESRTVVIPVPIKIDSKWREKRKIGGCETLAIVGRIHKDRGLEEFVRVCKILSLRFPRLNILVVGEGPHKRWLSDKMARAGIIDRTSFLGKKSQDELSSSWKGFGCIASFAPLEAYGRSARESLVYGVPVLAKHSSGLVQLHDQLSGRGIWFLDNLSDDEIGDSFRVASEFIIPLKVSESIIEERDVLAENLAKSWIGISKPKVF
jgi:glycosyltransferase involved in cell wall biosynthesis